MQIGPCPSGMRSVCVCVLRSWSVSKYRLFLSLGSVGTGRLLRRAGVLRIQSRDKVSGSGW